jgi:hypothetical protein
VTAKKYMIELGYIKKVWAINYFTFVIILSLPFF